MFEAAIWISVYDKIVIENVEKGNRWKYIFKHEFSSERRFRN